MVFARLALAARNLRSLRSSPSAHHCDHLVREALETILLYRQRARIATVEQPRDRPQVGDADLLEPAIRVDVEAVLRRRDHLEWLTRARGIGAVAPDPRDPARALVARQH